MRKTVALALILLMLLSSVSALADYGAIMKEKTTGYADKSMRTQVCTIPQYASVTVKSDNSSAAKVVFRGQTIYVRRENLLRAWAACLKARKKLGIDHTEDCNRIVMKSCWVYDCPSTSGRKIKKLRKGLVLTGFMEKNGWSILMDYSDTYYGYAKTSNLMGLSGGDGTLFKLSKKGCYAYF